MIKIMKKVFVLMPVITFMSLLQPAVGVQARGISGKALDGAGSDALKIAEENQAHPASDMGKVRINYMVDSLYMYKESIQVRFRNVGTGEYYTVSSEGFREDDVIEEIPEGEWEYYSVQFENEAVYGVQGHLVNEDSFSVSAGEETEIAIMVEEHQTNTQLMDVSLSVENLEGFNGTVQMWLEGDSDAYYTDNEGVSNSSYSGLHIHEKYTLRFDGNVGYNTKIDAGKYSVIKAYAYDDAGKPLDICYAPEFSISRHNDRPQIKVKIFPAGEAKNYGLKYSLQKAADTPDFTYNYYYRDVQPYKSYLGIDEEDIFEGLDSDEIQLAAEREEAEYQKWMEESGESHETVKRLPETEKEEGGGSSPFSGFAAVAMLAPVMAALWMLYSRLKTKKK